MKNNRAGALPPNGMPVLSRGRHAGPQEGACLMEYVSVLAGESFSDHPECVEPLLVRLAWAVNDTATAPVRATLVHFAPQLVGTRNDSLLTAPTLVATCVDYVASEAPLIEEPFLVNARGRAYRRLDRLEGRLATRRLRWADGRYRRWHAHDVMRECVRVLSAEAPESLPRLLDVAIGSVNGMPSESVVAGRAAAG